MLRELQKVELEILVEVDKFCKKHHIIYSLYAGTAIGAVRHHGYIPWDDDVDICMTRKELNRFRECWKQDPIPGYYFENCLDDPCCGTTHAKIRKEGTLFISLGDDESRGHHGIWIDIFPLEKIQTGWSTINVYWHAAVLNLLTRANICMLNDSLGKSLIRKAVRMIPYSFRKLIIQRLWQWASMNDIKISGNYAWGSFSALYAFKYRFPSTLIDEIVPINFEGKSFSIYGNYDVMLRNIYGDYMKLPPVEERICKHNPVKIHM